jgi:DNA-directed RNA polymerase subunit M/transcription elongation factor TFIIS
MPYKILDPDAFRANIRVTLEKLLYPEGGDGGDHRLSTNLEKGIYNHAIQEATKRSIIRKWENPNFVTLYVDKLRSIYVNLGAGTGCDTGGNGNGTSPLAQRIVEGEILPQQVAFMNHQQYAPERWQRMMEEKARREASKYNTEIQASTDVYQCKRCKSRKCIYSEQQVRSADEATTIFVTCLDCGKQWRT